MKIIETIKKIAMFITGTNYERFITLRKDNKANPDMNMRGAFAFSSHTTLSMILPLTMMFFFVMLCMILFSVNDDKIIIEFFEYVAKWIVVLIAVISAQKTILIIIGWIVPSNAMDKLKFGASISKSGVEINASAESDTNNDEKR